MQNNAGHVLVVEDDADIAEVVAIALRLEGCQVPVAATIADAYVYLGNESVDLMILDWRLPDGTGDQFAVTARALKPNLPIIVMSGWLNENAIQSCSLKNP